MRYDYSAVDFITFDCLGWPVTAIPEGGGTLFIEDFTPAVSGAAGTAPIAAARMGLRCLAVGGLGQDLMGDWVLGRLAGFGVDTSTLPRIPGARTSPSIVATRPGGLHPALHLKGATGVFTIEDAVLPQVVDARVVHLGGVGLMDAMDKGRNAARAGGARVTADVFAGSPDDLPAVASVLPHVDYFMPSIEEARALTGLTDLGDTARFFLDRGVGACVFTLGEDGAYDHGADGVRLTQPAFAVDVRCTCSDAFALALCRDMDPETAVRFAQAGSALTATGLGSQAGITSFDHTWDFMRTTPARPSAHAAATA